MYWFLILTPGIIYLHYLCSLHFHLSAHLALSHSHTCILSCIFHSSSLQTLLNPVPKRGWDQSSGVTPTTNLTTLSPSSYMSCTDTTYFNSFQIPLSLLIDIQCVVYTHIYIPCHAFDFHLQTCDLVWCFSTVAPGDGARASSKTLTNSK